MAKYNHTRTDYLRHAEELCQFASAVEGDSKTNKQVGSESINYVEDKPNPKRCNECGGYGHPKERFPRNKVSTKKVDFTLTISKKLEITNKHNWILDSGASMHLVNEVTYLRNAVDINGTCFQDDGQTVKVTKKGWVQLEVKTQGHIQIIRIEEVFFVDKLERNIISYGLLREKGCAISYVRGKLIIIHRKTGKPIFDIKMTNKVLSVKVKVDKQVEVKDQTVFNILEASDKEVDEGSDVQTGSLMHFHARLGHISYDTIEKMAKNPKCGILLTDTKRLNCLTCAQGKQTKNARSKRDSGQKAPTDRIGGVVCSDIKGPITPKDRFGNRYMNNFACSWQKPRMQQRNISYPFSKDSSTARFTFCAQTAEKNTKIWTVFAEFQDKLVRPTINQVMEG